MSAQPKQGPWTRIRPLQITEVDSHTAAAFKQAEITWGGFPNNLIKVMGYCPRLTQTEVEYCNTFIFDPETFVSENQVAGFVDRFLKELVISRTSLANRALYSITHHAFIGMKLFTEANRRDEAHAKYLHLHEHEKHPEVYTELERAALDYTVQVAKDPRSITDEDFQRLVRALTDQNRKNPRFDAFGPEAMDRYVMSQIVELTWLVGHFCLLNRWFTALQVPDEGPDDEADFQAAYEAMVPVDIRERNQRVLAGDL
jgi:alkylhydroperoxidase family enzyme